MQTFWYLLIVVDLENWPLNVCHVIVNKCPCLADRCPEPSLERLWSASPEGATQLSFSCS